jgi:hypothetical protein
VFGPFSAGDSLRVYRLQRKGLSLDLQRSLTQPSIPLWEAWVAFLTQQAMGQPTYVLYDLHDGEGFVQIRYRPHQAAADISYLAPTLEENGRAGNVWSYLLDGACIEAAGRGIQRVFASLPDSGAEVEVFHQSGFALYAGEDIYRLAQPLPAEPDEGALDPRAQRPEDWSAIQKLCVVITPQRVRQAEGGVAVAAGNEKNCERYVVSGENDEELAAVLNLRTGGQAYWLRVLVHPNTRGVAEDLVRWALSRLVSRPPHPVYCNVRNYESGIRAALEAAGFEPFVTRALMVKHTLAWSKAPAQELAQALTGSAEVAPPAYRINGEPDLAGREGRLAATRDS